MTKASAGSGRRHWTVRGHHAGAAVPARVGRPATEGMVMIQLIERAKA
ncbi:hypothetical protein N825_36425 [Skermanella stibiiresistens SB22]|uniref:Uncharacterized protein n=1 Tax=Skermanella stibiiresistens SB22 TaxID=1385369 RepID=W9H2H8_9PROT|nr:hypothetical protein N825_36425 [Skermanella stibiiresistens SB22]